MSDQSAASTLPEYGPVRRENLSERWKIQELKRCNISPVALIDQKCRGIYSLRDADRWSKFIEEQIKWSVDSRRNAIVENHKHDPFESNSTFRSQVHTLLHNLGDVEYIYWKYKEGAADPKLKRMVLQPELHAFFRSLQTDEQRAFRGKVKARVDQVASSLRLRLGKRLEKMNSKRVFHPKANAERAHSLYMSALYQMLSMSDIQNSVLEDLRRIRSQKAEEQENGEAHFVKRLRRVRDESPSDSREDTSAGTKSGQNRQDSKADTSTSDQKFDAEFPFPRPAQDALDKAGVMGLEAFKATPEAKLRAEVLVGPKDASGNHFRQKLAKLGNAAPKFPDYVRVRDIIAKADRRLKKTAERSSLLDGIRPASSRPLTVPEELGSFATQPPQVRQQKAVFHNLGMDPVRCDFSERLVGKNLGSIHAFYGKVYKKDGPSAFTNVFQDARSLGTITYSSTVGSSIEVTDTRPSTASSDDDELSDSGQEEENVANTPAEDKTVDKKSKLARIASLRRLATRKTHVVRTPSSSVCSSEDTAGELRERLETVFESLRFSTKDQCEFMSDFCDVRKAKEFADRVYLWEKAASIVKARERVMEYLESYERDEFRSINTLLTESEKDELATLGMDLQVPDAVSWIEDTSLEDRFLAAKIAADSNYDDTEDAEDAKTSGNTEILRTALPDEARALYARILNIMEADTAKAREASYGHLCKWKQLLDEQAKQVAGDITNHGEVLLYCGKPYIARKELQEMRSKTQQEA